MFWPFQTRTQLRFHSGNHRNQWISHLNRSSLVMLLKNRSISIESMKHVSIIDWMLVPYVLQRLGPSSIPSMMQPNLWAFASMFLQVSTLNSVMSVLASVQPSSMSVSSLYNTSNTQCFPSKQAKTIFFLFKLYFLELEIRLYRSHLWHDDSATISRHFSICICRLFKVFVLSGVPLIQSMLCVSF